MVPPEPKTFVLESVQLQVKRNEQGMNSGAGHENSSSVFLSSSDNAYSVEALGAVPTQCRAPEGFDQDANPHYDAGRTRTQPDSDLTGDIPYGTAALFQQRLVGPGGCGRPLRPPGPFLWRLFPRCIRTTTEEVCIAAEATLNVSPSECHVTVVKDGIKLPVRVDFLNDRQATGDDIDQASRHSRGPGSSQGAMQAIAAWQRRAGRDHVNHVLRSHRPDSELVLIWITPGTSPGLMLIELYAPPPISSSGGGGGAYSGSSGSVRAHPGAASTGALESAWHSPAAAGSAAPVRGLREAVAAAAGWPSALETSATNRGGDSSRTLVSELDAGGHQSMRLAAALNRHQVFGLSAPGPMQRGRSDHLWPPLDGVGAMRSSGALTVVVVPDAGMEEEICALLAVQHQQLPLPVTSGGPEDAVGEDPAAPMSPEDQEERAASASRGGPSRTAVPQLRGNACSAALSAALSEGMLANGLLAEMDEDKDDARARERFLWDLGAWLDSTVRRAAAREMSAQAAETIAATAAATAANPTASQRALLQMYHGYDQAHQHLHQRHMQQQPLRRALDDIQPVSEIEPIGEAHYDIAIPGTRPALRAEVWAPQFRTGDCSVAVPEEQQPMPQTALELLGFACSRGWAATSTNIILGLMDMGYSMQAINTAVQGAHGWSALHLAVASGSAELVAMTALWRSYGRYGDGPAVQEEWRTMLATPGPGGLTPLHLAAVLPHPATAAMDLLSTLPAETLTTWFGEAACDGCTPAHYASRAGNVHLNEHALLCLATGTAALDLGTAGGLQEVLPYLSEPQTDMSTITCSDSADFAGGTQEVRSIGPRSEGCGAAAADAPGGILPNPNTLASPVPSPTLSGNTTFESASEGSSKPPESLPEARTDPALIITHAGPLSTAPGGATIAPASTHPTAATTTTTSSTSSSLAGGRITPVQPVALAAPPLAVEVNLSATDSVTNTGSSNAASHSTGGGLRSAVRSLVEGSAAHTMSSLAKPEAAAPAKNISFRSLRRSLPLLWGCFQCLGGGTGVDEYESGAQGHGSGDDRGLAAPRRSHTPRPATWTSAMAGSGALGAPWSAHGPSTLAPSTIRGGTQQESQPLSLTEHERCNSISNNQTAAIAAATEPQSLLHPQPQLLPPKLLPLPELRQMKSVIDTPPTISCSTLAPNDDQGNSTSCRSGPSNAREAAGQSIFIPTVEKSTGNNPTRSDVQLSQMHFGALGPCLGEPYFPRPQPLTHEPPPPLSRATDPTLWSTEPWNSQKRTWPEPMRVIAGLLDRVSPVTSHFESLCNTSPSWSTRCSQQPPSGPGNWRCSLSVAPLHTTVVPAAPETSVDVETARHVAAKIMEIAAAAAQNVTASAPAEPTAQQLTEEAGAAGAAMATEADEALVKSAPAAIGACRLMDLINPLYGHVLQRQLLRQALEHRERVRNQLMRAMRRMHMMRPGCQALPGGQAEQLQLQRLALEACQLARSSSQHSGIGAGSEQLLQQQQQQQQQQRTVQTPSDHGPGSMATPSRPIRTFVDAVAPSLPPLPQQSHHPALPADSDRSTMIDHHLSLARAASGVTARENSRSQAVAATATIVRGDGHTLFASTITAASTDNTTAMEVAAPQTRAGAFPGGGEVQVLPKLIRCIIIYKRC
ncbi:hypothetical protein Vretimale_3201 [Volvox reticuliferus]|uniref:Uncharacterized protein n=1 Tax=Volvox reticuliferus TaxID=1737510 RepID=A0A8J4DB76_9CHLO|nr:hypothetical protein Vretifemale_6677 [Volvox reticuliferus]GIL97573.1 hypothetical protein Vretimale_3201 [Volvox reticuliferus]